MTQKNKDYSNGEITIHWQPAKCMHSANCIRALPGVFNPRERPWINIKNADTEHLVEAVDKCPSGALTYSRVGQDGGSGAEPGEIPMANINIFRDGPIEVKGHFELTDMDGNMIAGVKKVTLCRCGMSSNKPFCDGSHRKSGFKG